MSANVVLLVSSTTTDSAQEIGQRRVNDALISKRVVYSTVDGSMPEEKERRDQLFAVSSMRGKYPQVFIEKDGGELIFVGQWEKIQELLECDDIPAEVLASNPTIETFTKTFVDVKRQ